jgi:hypothetical protein
LPDNIWFATNAAQYGNLVYFMDQRLTDPMASDGPWGDVSGGYCAGLAVRWVRLAYEGRDFEGKPGYNFGGVPVRYFNGTDYQAVLYQNQMRQYSDAVDADLRMRITNALRLAQMVLGAELFEDRPVAATGTRLTRILKQSYGCYYVSLRATTSGHAIAMRHARPPKGGPGFLHIFDANAGHFAWQLPVADWPTIIDGYLSCMGYNKDFKERYLIGRAQPPIS